MDSDSRKPGVVGLKQVLRGLDADRLSAVYLADDAEEHIRSRVIERCRMRNVPVIPAESMSVLAAPQESTSARRWLASCGTPHELGQSSLQGLQGVVRYK